nr:hypothetical protein [Nocardioides piscis]
MPDPRRATPRTDHVLADPRLREAALRLGTSLVRTAVADALERCRAGLVAPESVADDAVAALPASATTLRRVINATGVLVHTNLGRAPLSAAATDAVRTAAGATDVELDLATGRRGRRGAGALSALAARVPDAGAVHVVNNGAAALALVTRVLTRPTEGGTVVIARGELVEIGDGFRIPELLESVGARLREVGTTNRVRLADYAAAVDDDTAFVLKVHPSNFTVEGFTSSVSVSELATLGVPVVVDIGSGLLVPTLGCPTSPMRPPRCGPGPRWSPPPATSCSEDRSAACSWGTPSWSSDCAATPSPGPCASTSSPWLPSRRRWPAPSRRSPLPWGSTWRRCAAAPATSPPRSRRRPGRRSSTPTARSGVGVLPVSRCPAVRSPCRPTCPPTWPSPCVRATRRWWAAW